MKRFLARLAAACLAFCASATLVFAQGAVIQSGPATQFHVPAWWGNGVQGDGGTPAAPYVSALGLFGGASCPFGISSQTGLGVNTSPAGTLQICQTLTTTTFMISGVNGASAPSLVFNIGGTLYPFPGGGAGTGNVTGPGSSTANDLACFNNTAGTLIKDCGTQGTFAGQNYATPPAIGGGTPAAGAFTTLSATSTVSGAGVTALFASPPAIGGTAPAAVAATTLSATSTVNGAGVTALFASPPSIGGTAPAAIKGTTLNATSAIQTGGVVLCSATAPTVTSAGTSPSIVDNNGTCSFTVNVGTGGTATSVVLGLPTATTGWTCTGSDITTQSGSVFLQKQTASSTTSATIINYNTAGTATAFVASDKLRMACYAD